MSKYLMSLTNWSCYKYILLFPEIENQKSSNLFTIFQQLWNGFKKIATLVLLLIRKIKIFYFVQVLCKDVLKLQSFKLQDFQPKIHWTRYIFLIEIYFQLNIAHTHGTLAANFLSWCDQSERLDIRRNAGTFEISPRSQTWFTATYIS